jgi:hypothetical protein
MGDNISFVVQGPIISPSYKEDGVYSTAEVLNSIRTHYPDAEIVLSTWKESNVEGLIFNQLVLNDDPGGFIHEGVLINNNRLILSAKEGIRKASNPVVVKTRTDILITNNNLLQQIEHLYSPSGDYGIFDRFVLSSIYYVRNPLKLNLVFHPSDIFLVGTREDLLAYFDVPLETKEFFVNTDNSTRMAIEQYFFVHSILKKQNKNFYIPTWGYTSVRYFAASEKYLFSNFRFFSTAELGIEFPKRLYTAFMHRAIYSLKQARLFSALYNGPLCQLFNLFRSAQYMARYHVPYYLRLLKHKLSAPIQNRLKLYKVGGTNR